MLSADRLARYRAGLENLGQGASDYVAKMLRERAERHPDMSADEWREFAKAVVSAAVENYGDAGATLAADLYDERVSASGARSAQLRSGADETQVDSVVRYQLGKLLDGDLDGFARECGAYAADTVRRFANSTMACNWKRDRKRASAAMRKAGVSGVRFARVPQGGETCTFCAMLASRGFVYWSEDAAGKFDHYHRNCRCLVIPSTEADGVEGYDPSEWYDRWRAYEEIDGEDGLTRAQRDAKKAAWGKPTNAVGAKAADNRPSSNVVLTKEQYGKKLRKHAREWGLDPSSKEDRDRLEEIITDIIDHADAVDIGDWRDQPNPCTFFRKGNDLVIVDNDGKFVTVMRGGGDNKRYKNAITGQGGQVQGDL